MGTSTLLIGILTRNIFETNQKSLRLPLSYGSNSGFRVFGFEKRPMLYNGVFGCHGNTCYVIFIGAIFYSDIIYVYAAKVVKLRLQ